MDEVINREEKATVSDACNRGVTRPMMCKGIIWATHRAGLYIPLVDNPEGGGHWREQWR
jgi:hypothetical protein